MSLLATAGLASSPTKQQHRCKLTWVIYQSCISAYHLLYTTTTPAAKFQEQSYLGQIDLTIYIGGIYIVWHWSTSASVEWQTSICFDTIMLLNNIKTHFKLIQESILLAYIIMPIPYIIMLLAYVIMPMANYKAYQ